jgi:hypothetical protein
MTTMFRLDIKPASDYSNIHAQRQLHLCSGNWDTSFTNCLLITIIKLDII